MKSHATVWARRWPIVLAAGLIMGTALGIRHVQGLFLQPITMDQGWTREAFGFTLATQNLVWGLAQPFTGMIADRYGSIRVLLPGVLLYAFGLFITAHSVSTGDFLAGNGLLIGLALSGTAFGAVYGALSRLFAAEHRSWALAVAGAVGGMGQFVMVPLVQNLLDTVDWSSTLIILAGVMLVLAPLTATLRDDPAAASHDGLPAQGMVPALQEAGRHRGFWLLNLGFFACGFQLAFIAGHLPSYLLDQGMGPQHASAALAIISLTNIVGTYACGIFGGFMRRKFVLSVVYLMRSAAMLAFVLLPLSTVTLYAFSGVMGLLWLGTVPLTNGLIAQIFGVRYITTLFGLVFFGHQLGSFFGVWLGGVVFDVAHSYAPIWFGAICLGLVAAALHLPINDAGLARLQRNPQPLPQTP